MFEVLFSHITEKVQISEDETELIKGLFVSRKLKKRQFLLQEGDVCKHLSFVSKGLLRSYNIDDKGAEHISLFAWEGWWISDFHSFLSGDAAVFNIDALENTELLMITQPNYEALTLAVPTMDRYFRILYQNSLVTKDRRLMSSITHNAEDKYRQLVEKHPDIHKRIPQNLIASYLGIAPETLSRIKKNVSPSKDPD